MAFDEFFGLGLHLIVKDVSEPATPSYYVHE